MLGSLRSVVLRVAMTLLLAASLLATAVLPRAMASAADLETQRVLVGIGLTTADLCLGGSGDSNGMAMGDCLLCHLTEAVSLPRTTTNPTRIAPRFAASLLIPARAVKIGGSDHPAPPARAPPRV